jgi:hypothetical protein
MRVVSLLKRVDLRDEGDTNANGPDVATYAETRPSPVSTPAAIFPSCGTEAIRGECSFLGDPFGEGLRSGTVMVGMVRILILGMIEVDMGESDVLLD